MTVSKKLSAKAIVKAIRACIDNGERLLEETYDLEFRNPPSTRYFLIMIVQEEFAKAFILFLVKENIVPLSPYVLRAMNDHACKQLVGMIMDYMIMHWEDEEELKAMIEKDHDLGDRLPDDVGSAMELLRYEKIGRWESNSWVWAEDPSYDPSALRVAKGKKDRRKQDALYVRVGRDGQICSTPHAITDSEVRSELERAGRYKWFLKSALEGTASPDWRYEKAIAALRFLFKERRNV